MMTGSDADLAFASYAEGVRDGKLTIARMFRCVLNDIARRTKNTAEAIAAAYAHGDFYILTRDKSKQQSVSFYLEAHAKQA